MDGPADQHQSAGLSLAYWRFGHQSSSLRSAATSSSLGSRYFARTITPSGAKRRPTAAQSALRPSAKRATSEPFVSGCIILTVSWQVALTLAVPASVAILGFFVAYVVNLRLARRSDQLAWVSRQLSDFYGPLYALVKATDISWTAFRANHRPGGSFWKDSDPPSEADAAAWRLWMSLVFMPLNRQMRDLVVTQAQLLDDDQVPDCLLTLCAHVSTYEAILGRWAKGDFSEHVSAVAFPRQELTTYAVESFGPLKSKQQRLIRSTQRTGRYGPTRLRGFGGYKSF